MAKRSPSIPKRLAFALAPLLLLLVVGEVVVRLAWHPESRPESGIGMSAHETRIWGLIEGSTQTAFDATFSVGPDGLRVVEAAPDARLRALTLGDSSIFGHGLPDRDTLHAAIRRSFQSAGLDVDVRCGGIPGYSTEQSLALLDEVGWALDPHLLVIGNLWSDNDFRYFSDREWMDQLRRPGFTVEWFLQRSQLWRWTRNQIAPPKQENLPVGWVRDPYATGRRRVPPFDYARNLDTILLEAARRGVSVVMLSPCNRTLADPSWSRPTVWDLYFRIMRDVAARRDVPLVAACDLLKQRGLNGDTAFLDEMHPTGLTNGIYGKAVVSTAMAGGWPFRPVLPDSSLPLWDEPIEDSADPSHPGR